MSDVKTAKIGIRSLKVRRFTVSATGRKNPFSGSRLGNGRGNAPLRPTAARGQVGMEKEMNFDILRNCLGNVSRRTFRPCDRYGLMVWEEFGLNHEIMPDNMAMWLANARNRLLVRRNHACVALRCTANEGGPREPIASAMPKLVAELDGTRFYQRHSTTAPTDGDGTYDTRRPTYYFENTRGFRPECGSHTVPAVESMRRMMPHEKLGRSAKPGRPTTGSTPGTAPRASPPRRPSPDMASRRASRISAARPKWSTWRRSKRSTRRATTRCGTNAPG